MTTPWMKWYPSDWRADPRLRICSLAARGLWKEMICLMHEADPYGSLLVNGMPVNEKQLASLVGSSPREVAACLRELEVAGMFSVDNGVVYSRRMKRDREKAERDKANGSGGGNPILKGVVNPPVNGVDKAQIPESRIQKDKTADAASAKEFAFEGGIIKLNRKNFDDWVKGFPNLDLLGELRARDAWLGSPKATDEDRRNWFISTSKYLANRNMEARAKVSALRPPERRGIEGIV